MTDTELQNDECVRNECFCLGELCCQEGSPAFMPPFWPFVIIGAVADAVMFPYKFICNSINERQHSCSSC